FLLIINYCKGSTKGRAQKERSIAQVIEECNPRQVFNNPYASLSIQQQRIRLPIFRHRNQIIYLMERYQSIVLVGETGCGKSTQVPQYLYEAGWGKDGIIGVTQPRRVAAVALASRVADERMTMLGNEVGYAVRFDDFTDPEATRIKYLTDGILIREIMKDPLLKQYCVIMIDEVHERNLCTDVILGLLRKIIAKRKDLRVIISSATLDAELYCEYFNFNTSKESDKDTCKILSVEGRNYPVEVFYMKNPVPDYIQATISTILKIHRFEAPSGDILAFLSGQDEVEAVCSILRSEGQKLKNCDRLWVLPAYGALPFKDQVNYLIINSYPVNIFDLFIFISGRCYQHFIDCGFVKLRALHPRTGIESLMLVPISKASAEQRSGRAGRIRPGKAYRMYPEEEYMKLSAHTVPEIQRCNLAPMVLQMKVLGIQNILRFHYLSHRFNHTRELLFALGGKFYRLYFFRWGNRWLKCPFPQCAQSSEEMLSIISMLQIQDVFLFPVGHKHKAVCRKMSVEEGDHLTMLNVFTAFQENGCSQRWCQDHYLNYRGLCRCVEIRLQLLRFLQKFNVPIASCRGRLDCTDRIARCLVSGFFSNAAKLHTTGLYHTVRENFPLKIYKGSAIMYRKEYPPWVVFNEVLSNSMRDITVIDPHLLCEVAPHFYEFGTRLRIL
ncbi:unnamed protein product, partial [Soboliphyme baturini]|uniref:RNA helicase n=1 Tax=Soboliphyme baturini TaxID=241478 RepID=A0A183IJP2_9BILA